MMDFHPLIIHYPIALLTTYAVAELIRFKRLLQRSEWSYLKGVLVLLGEIGALATILSTFLPQSSLSEDKLTNTYKIFMNMTAVWFGIIAFCYIRGRVNPKIVVPLAIIGLFFIVIAGGLFGATVYGTHFDPFLAPIFKLLNVF